MAIHVLYNATSARVGGGLSYALQQLTALAGRDELVLDVLVSPWNREYFGKLPRSGKVRELIDVRVPNASLRFVWEQVQLPRLAREYDVLVCPGNFAPLIRRRPTILILQNPNYVGIGRQEPHNKSVCRRLKIAQSHAAMRRSDIVVLISRSLQQEFQKERRLRGVRTRVIYSGRPDTSATLGPLPSSDALPPEPFVMSVANDYPHKNLPDIARGWRLYRDHYSTPLKLVYVGSAAKETRNAVLEEARPHEADVIFLGPVADRAYITELYRRAAAAISASSQEAFPLTLHEAGSLGCPLILSDIAPHRELAKRRAAYFPLHGTEELASEIDDVMGRPRPEPWEWGTTWETHARQLTDAIRSLLEVRL